MLPTRFDCHAMSGRCSTKTPKHMCIRNLLFIYTFIHFILDVHLVQTRDLACQREAARQSHTAAALAIAQKLMYLGWFHYTKKANLATGRRKARVWGSKKARCRCQRRTTKVARSIQKSHKMLWTEQELVYLSNIKDKNVKIQEIYEYYDFKW